jgi:hypothetical protein
MWYRKHYDLDVDGVLSHLDHTINEMITRYEEL